MLSVTLCKGTNHVRLCPLFENHGYSFYTAHLLQPTIVKMKVGVGQCNDQTVKGLSSKRLAGAHYTRRIDGHICDFLQCENLLNSNRFPYFNGFDNSLPGGNWTALVAWPNKVNPVFVAVFIPNMNSHSTHHKLHNK